MSSVWTHIFGVLIAAVLGLTESELQVALRGEIPTKTESFTSEAGKAAGRGIGAIVIDRPIAETWSVLRRFDDKAEYMPRVEKVWILAATPERLHVRMQVDASVTTARYTAFFQLDSEGHTIRWTLDKSALDNTVVDAVGSYELHAVHETQTLLVYRNWVDSGRSVPRFIHDYMSRRAIPNLLRAIKKRVESGGTWRK